MTISTIHTEPVKPPYPRHGCGRRRSAFTLVEVVIGATIGSFILAGVLSAFLMLGRSGVNAANYSVSETEIRRAIEAFSRDLRMAKDINWTSATSITLTVPNNYGNNANTVTYTYDPATTGATAQCFYRTPADGLGAATATRILIHNVSSLAFARYNRLDVAATNNTETKRIQLTLNVRRTGQTLVAANTMLVSASYTLRNKPVN